MSRRRHRPEWDEHVAGVRANFDTDCERCGGQILVGMRVARLRDSWIHIQCQSGWDE